MRELPLNARNFLQLTQLMPGVTTLNNFSTKNKGLLTGSDVSVSGGSVTSNLWSVDGASNNDIGSNRTVLVYPSLEAVEEFKIHRNSSGTEFGGGGGAQINLVTRGEIGLTEVEVGPAHGVVAIADLCDLSVYVMTSEYGSPCQLEKIEMLDFADLVAINKFTRCGSEELRPIQRPGSFSPAT